MCDEIINERSRLPNGGDIVFAILSICVWDEPNQEGNMQKWKWLLYLNSGIIWDLSKVSPVLFHHFLINKTNQSSFSNAYICTMSNTWVEGKKVPSVSSLHLLPNIRHLESLNEPNDWIFHASLKILGSRKDRSLWIACKLHGEADLGRNAVEGNALLREIWEGVDTVYQADWMKDVFLFSHLFFRFWWETWLQGSGHLAGDRCWSLRGKYYPTRPCEPPPLNMGRKLWGFFWFTWRKWLPGQYSSKYREDAVSTQACHYSLTMETFYKSCHAGILWPPPPRPHRYYHRRAPMPRGRQATGLPMGSALV